MVHNIHHSRNNWLSVKILNISVYEEQRFKCIGNNEKKKYKPREASTISTNENPYSQLCLTKCLFEMFAIPVGMSRIVR